MEQKDNIKEKNLSYYMLKVDAPWSTIYTKGLTLGSVFLPETPFSPSLNNFPNARHRWLQRLASYHYSDIAFRPM